MTKSKYYAGIGSRNTPEHLRPLIESIVNYLNGLGYVLRSGGAPGADTFFEDYSNPNLREIYLPWRRFNRNESPLYTITPDALKLAQMYHPAWNKLKPTAYNLMARNCYQVLGFDLSTPSEFIICWTEDGKMKGGTSQAMRIANDRDIPIINLYHDTDLETIKDKIKGYGRKETQLL